MGEWMVFMRKNEGAKMFFSLIKAQDIHTATEIGEELASRSKVVLVGIAPFLTLSIEGK